MTVSNGLSLTTLNCKSVLWQFQTGGVYHKFYPHKSENLISQMFRHAHQKGLFASHQTNQEIEDQKDSEREDDPNHPKFSSVITFIPQLSKSSIKKLSKMSSVTPEKEDKNTIPSWHY